MKCRAHVTTAVANCLACQGLTLPKSHKARNPLAAQRAALERKGLLKLATSTRVRLEHEEQADLFTWAELESTRHPELLELFAIPNGARTAMSVARKLKAEGLKAGVEDVMLLVARGGYHGLLIEMKRTDASPSDVKPEQLAWHATHTRRGYKVVVCKGAEEAKATLLSYLSLPVTKVKHP